MHYSSGDFCKWRQRPDPLIADKIIWERMFIKTSVQPICTTWENRQIAFELKQAGEEIFVMYDKENCIYNIAILIDCGETQVRDYVNALYMFLDLRANQMIFGSVAIIFGLCFSFINYQSNSKRRRNLVIYLICVIIGVCGLSLPFYLSIFS